MPKLKNDKYTFNVMNIRAAEPADYGEMYTLQLAAFVDEARLYETADVPSLNESFEEFTERLSMSISWVTIDQKRIVGAISLRTCKSQPEIERLMVALDRRGKGIGSAC